MAKLKDSWSADAPKLKTPEAYYYYAMERLEMRRRGEIPNMPLSWKDIEVYRRCVKHVAKNWRC